MGKRPFLLLYINDFLGSPVIQAMTDSQVRWYLYLLMRAWQSEPACHLPNDDEQLRIMAGCKSKKQWDKQKSLVLSQFDVSDTKIHITNARLIAEYERICKISDTKRDASNKRWDKKMHMQSTCNPEDMQSDATSLTQTLLTSLTKPKSKPRTPRASASDERCKTFIEDLSKYWEAKNKGVPLSVAPADVRNLKVFLTSNPKVDQALFRQCLNNRARSPAVVHSQAIHRWICSILDFANSPLDRFNKPEVANGHREADPIDEAVARRRMASQTHEGNEGDVPQLETKH